jgi:hypothetical protein
MSNESTPDPKPEEAPEGTPKASEAAAKASKPAKAQEDVPAEAPAAAAEPVEVAEAPTEAPEPVAQEAAPAEAAPASETTPEEKPVTEAVEIPAESAAEVPVEPAKVEEPKTDAIPVPVAAETAPEPTVPAPAPPVGATASEPPVKVLRVPGTEEDDEEPKSGKGRLIAIAVVALVVVVGVVFAFNVFGSKNPSSAAAGDCVSLSGQTVKDSTLQTVDCAADNAVLKVGKRIDNDTDACPAEGFYQPYPAEGKSNEGFRLCLMPNLAEGACYKLDANGDNYVKGECKGLDTLKVVKVINGSDDTGACPDGAGESYPEPKLTYCFAPAES